MKLLNFANQTIGMRKLLFLIMLTIGLFSCNKDGGEHKDLPPITDTTQVLGYGILEDFAGNWGGPVSSTTPLGSYPEWIVDFRPISAGQLCGKAELDTVNDIFMGFFIGKATDKYVMTFRNGGGFAGMQRISYARCDSSYDNGTERYYRFVDFKAGFPRLFIEFRFRNDSVYMQSYTNKYNTLSSPTLHMQWTAKRTDTTAAQVAMQHFGFPQKQVIKDFSETFATRSDAVFYDLSSDPYSQNEHPYLGNTNVQCTFGNSLQTTANGKVILVVTTQPLFSGFTYVAANLKYRSRYVLLTGQNASGYTFDYMHPGSYYLNAFYDSNGDLAPQQGEYLQFPTDKAFTLPENGSVNLQTEIGFQIP